MIKIFTKDGNSKDFSVQQIFDILTDPDTRLDYNNEVECNPKVASERLIAWLPNIKELGVFRYFDYCFIDVVFKDNNTVRLYNTGYEFAFEIMVERTA